MIRFAVVSLFLAGCSYSSLDDEIQPELLYANVTVDVAQPDALAPVSVRLQLTGGKRASSPALLDRIALDDPNGPVYDPLEGHDLLRLDLVYPIDFSSYIHSNEVKQVDLHNVGTKNADLQPLCGQSVILRVWLADAHESGPWTVDDLPVAISCP
jgi:hypothetical protein